MNDDIIRGILMERKRAAARREQILAGIVATVGLTALSLAMLFSVAAIGY